MAAGERLRDEVRLVLCVELVAEVFDVPLNGSRSDAQLLGALFRREGASNALQHLAFPFGQGDEIFLLPRKIHHALRFKGSFAPVLPIALVITDLQELECFVPIPDRGHLNLTIRSISGVE